MRARAFIITLFPLILILLLFIQPFLSDVLTAKVSIGNAKPQVTNVHVDEAHATSPDNTIQIAAHNYRNEVWCNFTVTDNNGVSDIKTPKANLTRVGTSQYAADDSDVHYSNNSCTYNYTVNGNTLEFRCIFWVSYWADNGTWSCNVSVPDSQTVNNSEYDRANLSGVIGIEVNESEISYGTLAVGQDSPTSVSTTIYNTGNVMIDVRVNGTHMNDTPAMTNLLYVGNQTYNISMYPGAWGGTGSAQLTRSPVTVSNFNLDDRESTDGDSNPFIIVNKTLEWKIRIPSGQASGSYSGSVQIDGVYSP
ncbi:hypothetical protein DRN74_00405 [Candidatus Micrarchaeota archaeon]|nr:MAG: hypothetical protein DRN74_00405 [Candidatus Micrarchaeota archaeon]